MFSKQLNGKSQVIFFLGCIVVLSASLFAADIIIPVPESVAGVSQHEISLNGDWKFTLTPPANFWENGVDPAGWDDIVVPGEPWMQGFKIAQDVEYPYKKSISIPADFANQTIFLRFEGVYSIGRVWVNGNFAGEHYGGFTSWQLDITPYVTPGQSAWVTVGVKDMSDDIAGGSFYTSRYYGGVFEHNMGGILRNVTLFAVPETHITSLHYETDLDASYNNADLIISGSVNFDGATQVELELVLTDPAGESVPLTPNTITVSDSAPEFSVTIPVTAPMKWDAERPNLYTLTVQEKIGSTVVETIVKKVGFREIEINGVVCLVNGQPVKLRGGNRHSIHPTSGRSYVDSVVEKDVLLYKNANVNYVRTSHYPTSERFLELADKYGLYIEEEIAICFQDRLGSGNSSDPAYLSYFISAVSDTIERDRDHPSIIIWSLGNENKYWGTNFEAERDYARAEDATRPLKTGHNYYDGWNTADYTDLDSFHYPVYNSTGDSPSGKPLIFDEYAHVLCYYGSNSDASRDPGSRNFWGESMKLFWEHMYIKPDYLGGAIWGTVDEVFLAPDAVNGYGRWGIFDGWRREKPEHWNTKKAYSPIRIENKLYTLPASGQPLQIDIANWFDHTDLNELDITWSTGTLSGTANISLAPGGTTGTLDVHCGDLNIDDVVHLRFTLVRDELTLLVDEFNIRFTNPTETLTLSNTTAPVITQTATDITVSGTDFSMKFSKQSGSLIEGQYLGETIITGGPYLNLSPINLQAFSLGSITANVAGNIATVDIAGSYGTIDASFSIQIDHNGTMAVDYDAANIPSTYGKEVGLTFRLSDGIDQLSWDRNGLWSIYPADHIGRNRGTAIKERSGPELIYRDEPLWSWSLDMKDFHAKGKDHAGYGMTNDFRSQKEYIKTASTINRQTGLGVKVVPGDNLHAVRMQSGMPITENIVNNDDSAITYNGGWTYYLDSGNYGGDESFSLAAGAYAEFTFTGTYIAWMSPKNSNLGYADVYIDDVLVAQNIDCYFGYKIHQQVLFEQSGLTDTTHTIKVVVTGGKNPASSDPYLIIDAFSLSPLNQVEQGLFMHVNRHWEYNLGWGNYNRVDGPAANFQDQMTFGFIDTPQPQFTSDPIIKADATEGRVYSETIAGDATGNGLIFTKIYGPAWLSIAADGELSGVPMDADVGQGWFTVQAVDGEGNFAQVQMSVIVLNTYSGELGFNRKYSMDKAVALLSVFGLGMCFSLLGSISIKLMPRIKMDQSKFGSLISAFMFTCLVASLIMGVITDSVGYKPVAVFGFVATAVCIFILANAKSYGSVLVPCILLGFGAMALNTAGNTLIPVVLYGGENPAAASNLGNVFFGIGLFLTPFVVSFLFKKTTYEKAVSALGVIVLLPVVLALKAEYPQSELGFAVIDAAKLLAEPAVLIAALVLFCYIALDASFCNWLAPFGKEILASSEPGMEAGAADASAQRLISLYAIAMMAGRLIASQISAITVYGSYFIAGGALITAVIIFLLVGIKTMKTARILIILSSLVLAPTFPTTVGVTFAKFSSSHGSIFGIIFAVGLAGAVIIPKAIGNMAKGSSVQKSMKLLIPACVILIVLSLAMSKVKGPADREVAEETTVSIEAAQ